MASRPDWSTLRPWTAEPDADGFWRVTAPPKTPGARRQLVACRLTEEDAKTIAYAHPAMDVLHGLVHGAPEAHGEVCKNDPCARCYAADLLVRAGYAV